MMVHIEYWSIQGPMFLLMLMWGSMPPSLVGILSKKLPRLSFRFCGVRFASTVLPSDKSFACYNFMCYLVWLFGFSIYDQCTIWYGCLASAYIFNVLFGMAVWLQCIVCACI